ncbi:TonB C-terminal domain-containing protein [Luteimonas sp. R10]|uniref:TonB C-terminal domain-containing protein n=1 Tax=Luteimonas sp. R10 TaxID=3108176 RepID=UPI003091DD3F|nr:TonB C-terminal domain-containing protein [Luteimonas sp. R10]
MRNRREQGIENAVESQGAAEAADGGRRPGWLARAWARMSARRTHLLAGTALAAALSVAQAQEAVPEHWIVYARMTGNALQAQLSEGAGDLVTRMHAWMNRQQEQSGEPLSVVVRIWISPEGWVERSEFDNLGDAQADADLRAILSAHPLPEPPPPDMRQPLVLQLTLQPNPDYEPDVDRL